MCLGVQAVVHPFGVMQRASIRAAARVSGSWRSRQASSSPNVSYQRRSAACSVTEHGSAVMLAGGRPIPLIKKRCLKRREYPDAAKRCSAAEIPSCKAASPKGRNTLAHQLVMPGALRIKTRGSAVGVVQLQTNDLFPAGAASHDRRATGGIVGPKRFKGS